MWERPRSAPLKRHLWECMVVVTQDGDMRQGTWREAAWLGEVAAVTGLEDETTGEARWEESLDGQENGSRRRVSGHNRAGEEEGEWEQIEIGSAGVMTIREGIVNWVRSIETF